MKTATKKTKITEEILADARERLQELKALQNTAREEEIAIREYLANALHDGEEGSKTVIVGGIKLSITRLINRSITREDADRLKQENKKLWLECLTFRPEVRVAGYKEHRDELDEFI